MTLLGEVVENPRASRPLTGFGLGAAGKPEFAEQDVAELLRAARVERLAGERLDLGLERAGALREFTRQAREHRPINRDAATLHAREHWNEWPLQRLIHAADAIGGKTRLEHLPHSHRHVGPLCGIFG